MLIEQKFPQIIFWDYEGGEYAAAIYFNYFLFFTSLKKWSNLSDRQNFLLTNWQKSDCKPVNVINFSDGLLIA